MGQRWHEPAGDYTCFYVKDNENHYVGVGLFLHNKIVSTDKRVESVNDRMPYIIPRGRWCDSIVLSVQAPTEDKSDDIKDSSYEELEHLFDNFPNYHLDILLGDEIGKVRK
jgi:hypothetical protein